MRKGLSLVFIATSLLQGCILFDKKEPIKKIESVYDTPIESSSEQWNKDWWQSYNNTEINDLVYFTLSSNLELATAVNNVKKAGFEFKLSESNSNPTLNSELNKSIQKELKSGNPHTQNYSARLSVSYEIDLWNRLALQSDVKAWETYATIEDKEEVRLLLINNALDLYFYISYLNDAINLTKNSIVYYERLVELTTSRQSLGNLSQLDVLESQRALLSQQTKLTDLLYLKKEAENKLKSILNKAPSDSLSFHYVSLDSIALSPIEKDIPLGIIRSRPDVRASEYRLKASFSNIEARKADYYPRFTLTSSLGTSSSELAQLLTNPIGTLGAGIVMPFLNWNERHWTLKVSETDYENAVISFRKTLLSALTEVDNSINAYNTQSEKLQYLIKNKQLSTKISSMNQVRYEMGKLELKDWLDSQEIERQLLLSILEAKYNAISKQNTLYKTLGGKYNK